MRLLSLIAAVGLAMAASGPAAGAPAAGAPAADTPEPETPEADTPAADTPEAETPEAITPAVTGPLYPVSLADEEQVEPTPEDIRQIYDEADDVFVTAFWWWCGLIAVLAGLGGGAYWIWGRRGPRRLSGL